MQRWEYKLIVRVRGFVQDTSRPNLPWMVANDWDVDMEKEIVGLGNEGWELVAVTPRSSYLGGFRDVSTYNSYDYAGFTSQELWTFKRPKP